MQKSGRPPDWSIAHAFDQLPWFEAIQLSSKRRLNLGTEARRRITWLGDEGLSTALAALEEPGMVSFVPWSPNGELVEARLEQLSRDSALLSAREEAIAIQSKYSRVRISADGRFVVPLLVVAALGHEIMAGTPFYLIVFDTHFELHSPERVAELALDFDESFGEPP